MTTTPGEAPETKEWVVDWEVDVDVTFQATVKHAGTEIIEAATAEEAVQIAKDDLYVTGNDLSLSDLDPDDFEVTIDEDTFRVNGEVKEWHS